MCSNWRLKDSNNSFSVNVGFVVHDGPHFELQAWGHVLPNWLLFAPVVEPNGVLVHVLDIGVVQETAHQLAHASLGLVWVVPRSIVRWSPLFRYLIFEVAISSKLAAIVLEIATLDDRVAEWLGWVENAIVEVLLCGPHEILLALIRFEAVTDAIK